MNTLLKTMLFDNWLASLRDGKAKIKIVRRIERARQGDYGPGYRLYYAQKGSVVYVLLCGGGKSSQQSDIRCATEIWRQING